MESRTDEEQVPKLPPLFFSVTHPVPCYRTCPHALTHVLSQREVVRAAGTGSAGPGDMRDETREPSVSSGHVGRVPEPQCSHEKGGWTPDSGSSLGMQIRITWELVQTIRCPEPVFRSPDSVDVGRDSATYIFLKASQVTRKHRDSRTANALSLKCWQVVILH